MKDHMEKETEELSKLLMEWYNKGFSDCQEATINAAESAIDMAILLEREACAKLCDAMAEDVVRFEFNQIIALERCAEAIRARGEK
jgi:hypothetical protein